MSAYATFEELKMAAVQAFVRTAILIDNEPYTGAVPPAGDAPKKATSAAASHRFRPKQASEALTTQSETEREPSPAVAAPTLPEPTSIAGHQLAVRPVTNAFAAKKITCGFYFPTANDADLVEVAYAAAQHVDATIIDWQLREKDTTPAKELITKLLLDDRAEGGRLRLIVVYTGERGLDAECAKLLEHLNKNGLTDFKPEDQNRALSAPHTLITFANKPAVGDRGVEREGPAARPIAWDALPAFVLESYTRLSAGLLQAFALSSIGAVRDDTHHLLSMFPPKLDAAFLAQRAGIGDPGDAEELMTALLVSEFSASIRDRDIAARTLGGDTAAFRVQARERPETMKVEKYSEEPIYKDIVKATAGSGKHILADEATLATLVRNGLDSKKLVFKKDRKKLELQLFADDADGARQLGSFARLATLTRESGTSRRTGRGKIALTGGVIVRTIEPAREDAPEKQTYLLCVQPGCDAVRLQGVYAFPFCRMKQNADNFDLILSPGAGLDDATYKVERKPRDLQLVNFEADPTSQTVQTVEREGKVGFTDTSGTFWEFIAELRPLEAQHFTTLLVGKFNRVALNTSEWLRLRRGQEEN